MKYSAFVGNARHFAFGDLRGLVRARVVWKVSRRSSLRSSCLRSTSWVSSTGEYNISMQKLNIALVRNTRHFDDEKDLAGSEGLEACLGHRVTKPLPHSCTPPVQSVSCAQISSDLRHYGVFDGTHCSAEFCRGRFLAIEATIRMARCRSFDDGLGSGVVFWIDVPHVHVRTFLPGCSRL